MCRTVLQDMLIGCLSMNTDVSGSPTGTEEIGEPEMVCRKLYGINVEVDGVRCWTSYGIG
jgi:hypothetical protein